MRYIQSQSLKLSLLCLLCIALMSQALESKQLKSFSWQVELEVASAFPPGISSEVFATIAWPVEFFINGPASYIITERTTKILVRGHGRLPTHVLMRFRAAGFEPQWLNTGRLEFKTRHGESYAKVRISPKFEPANAPQIINTLPGGAKPASPLEHYNPVFEITLFNPLDHPAIITHLRIQADKHSSCSIDPSSRPEKYIVRIKLPDAPAEVPAPLSGIVFRENEASDFYRPIHGHMRSLCGYDLEADVFLNAVIPQNDIKTLRFTIEIAKAGEGAHGFTNFFRQTSLRSPGSWKFELTVRTKDGSMTLMDNVLVWS